MALNETHDPQLSSWVAAANTAGTDFTLQNLPLGIFRRAGSSEAFRGGVAIGDQILDLAALLRAGVMDAPGVDARAAFRLAAPGGIAIVPAATGTGAIRVAGAHW